MVESQKMGEVLIIASVVHGEAPGWIRRAWFGIVLECHPVLGYADESTPERGLLSGQSESRKQWGVSVPQDKAIEALDAAGKIEAAQWFRDRGFPRNGENFFFREEEVAIVKGVVRQRLIKVEDDDRGNPYR